MSQTIKRSTFKAKYLGTFMPEHQHDGSVLLVNWEDEEDTYNLDLFMRVVSDMWDASASETNTSSLVLQAKDWETFKIWRLY